MAAGDKAAAAGLSVVPSTADARQGYVDINVRGDELAEHMTNGTHTWGQVTGKPTGAPAATALALTASVIPSVGSNVQADMDFINGKADAASSTAAGASAAASAAYSYADAANTNANGRALNYGGDANAVRYSEGPTSSAYNRSLGGSGRFAVWMQDDLTWGRNTSARRYKQDVELHEINPAAVLALRPVTYHRIGSPAGEREFGLIADDVEQTVPEVCTYFPDADGVPVIDGVRYDLLAVALLAVVQDQQRQLDELRDHITRPTTED